MEKKSAWFQTETWNHRQCNETSKVTQQQIADYFSIVWGLPVKHRTVKDIISNKETYDSEDDQGTPCTRHCTCK